MKRLIFKSCYLVPIIDGLKTSTIRRRCNLREGDALRLNNGYSRSMAFGEAVVVSNAEIGVHELTDELAQADGIADAPALIAALAQLYPDALSLRLIHFRLTRVVATHPLVVAHRRATRK